MLLIDVLSFSNKLCLTKSQYIYFIFFRHSDKQVVMEVYCPHRAEEVKINSSCSSSPGDRKVACGRQTSLDDAMLSPPDGVSDASIYSDVRNTMDESHDHKSLSSSASSCYHSDTSLQDKVSIGECVDYLTNRKFIRSQGEGQTMNVQTDSIFQKSSDDFTFSTLEDATGSLTAILDRSIDSECLTWDTQCCQDTQGESLNDWLQGTPTRGRSVESLASSLEGDSPGVSTRPVQGSPAEISPSSCLVNRL